MNARVRALSAERALLQARCRREREEVRRQYGGLEERTARADQWVGLLREHAPIIAVGAVAALLLLGPRRILRFAKTGLVGVLYGSQVLRLLR